MYDTKKTTTEYKRWHREEDGTMVPDVTDYVKLQAWIDTLDPRIKQEYNNIQEDLTMDGLKLTKQQQEDVLKLFIKTQKYNPQWRKNNG